MKFGEVPLAAGNAAPAPMVAVAGAPTVAVPELLDVLELVDPDDVEDDVDPDEVEVDPDDVGVELVPEPEGEVVEPEEVDPVEPAAAVWDPPEDDDVDEDVEGWLGAE